ncbi:hypothetical protein [Saccharothrix sp.]|uniref:hypothetical protein n=1 Tax=Saccharothrix sp. TaxID=1873460 RepID=UPI0028118BD9|nr:hypothetical protein [Saccharothrix sp.]
MTTVVGAEEFADLVYGDPAWLDAEFDAIVAANFPTEPFPTEPSPDRAEPPGHPVARRPVDREPVGVRVVLPVHAWARQRSPPEGRYEASRTS